MLDAAREEIDDLVANIELPPGIAVEVVHEETELDEFYFLITAAFILIYMILASVFESLSAPFVIMFTIPLATVGSFWAIILTGNSILNPITLIGFIILFGLVVNNGIILIDYTRILRKQGYSISRALMTAGQARVRPILITTITTIVAMIPLAMGQAEYIAQIGAPFAITVIGGLSLSTLFTLVFIPTVYSGLEVALKWMSVVNWKIKVLWAILFLAGVYMIFENVFSFVWRLACLIGLLGLIPMVTYFIMESLRQAREDIISLDEALHIKIKHVVKIYDDYSRFIREWKKGKAIREKAGLTKDYKSWKDFDIFLWQLPLLVFLIYFVYFYLRSSFWIFMITHVVYFYGFFFWKPISSLLNIQFEKSKKSIYQKIDKWFLSIFFWGFPLLNLVIYYLRWENITILIFIALFGILQWQFM